MTEAFAVVRARVRTSFAISIPLHHPSFFAPLCTRWIVPPPAEATYLEAATNERPILLLHAATNERPILLLDDVLSELDESRRHSVLTAIDADQVIITSPDPDRFDQEFVARAQLWRITSGHAERE